MSDDKHKNEDIESKSFDDAELEDIMNEIEELEKDFAQGKEDDLSNELSDALGIEEKNLDELELSVDSEDVGQTELQEVIDQEMEGILDDAIASNEVEPEPVEAAAEPVMEEVAEPVMEEVAEPVMEEVAEPVMEEVAEPVMEEVAEPVMEEVAEPVMEEVAEPVMEEVAEPVMEEVAEPVMEEVAEPVMEDAPGASDISARDEALEAIENKIVAFESSNEDKEEPMPANNETRMNFSVSGQMKLKLNFEVSGHIVELSVDEEGFVIDMDGGARFSIPLDEKYSKAS